MDFRHFYYPNDQSNLNAVQQRGSFLQYVEEQDLSAMKP